MTDVSYHPRYMTGFVATLARDRDQLAGAMAALAEQFRILSRTEGSELASVSAVLVQLESELQQLTVTEGRSREELADMALLLTDIGFQTVDACSRVVESFGPKTG